MSIKIIGATSGNIAEVDTSSNIKVVTPTNPSAAGYVKIVDGFCGTVERFTPDGRVDAGLNTLFFNDPIDGTAVNTNFWNLSSSNFLYTQGSGNIWLNSTSLTTANSYLLFSSIQYFNPYSEGDVHLHVDGAFLASLQSNATIEFGFGSVSGTSAPTDGAFFRYGVDFRAVINFNGTEVTSAPLTVPTVNTYHTFEILMRHDSVQFLVDSVCVVTLSSTTLPAITMNNRQPIFFRVYTGSVAPSIAPSFRISQVGVFLTTVATNKLWRDQLVFMGRSSYQSPVTTFGQTANYVNSTGPTSATLSNTVAGYTTLGGLYQFAAVAGAETDYALFAYQVPVGYKLQITDARISCFVMGAAIATTVTLLNWSLGLNSSGVSLATPDNPTALSWAPRRLTFGSQSFQVGAAVGSTTAVDLTHSFQTPLVIESGRYLHVILRMPVATATASQIIRGMVGFGGWFE